MNGQAVIPVEANSSPSHILATKGSSVWLHWNYTYVGDGVQGIVTLTYKEQIVGFNSTSQPTMQALAKRTGANGALVLESPVPVPFNGRVEVISANSTIVIRDLHYNDSAYQFSSVVAVALDAGEHKQILLSTNQTLCLHFARQPISALLSEKHDVVIPVAVGESTSYVSHCHEIILYPKHLQIFLHNE